MKLGKLEKQFRFYAKHPRASKIISLAVIVLAAFALIFCFDWPSWLFIPMLFVCSFFPFFVIVNAGNTLSAPAIRQMVDQGDPEPLLKISEELLTYPSSAPYRRIYTINYCAALDNMGEYDKAYELLGQIDIEEKNTHPIHKLVYYNNVASLRMSMGYPDEAIEGYRKALQAYAEIKNEKLSRMNEPTANHARAALAYLEGEYRTCLALLQTPMPTLTGQVGQAHLHALVAIAQGDVPTAKAKLNEVIEKGNKLYCVTEAKELLKTLE